MPARHESCAPPKALPNMLRKVTPLFMIMLPIDRNSTVLTIRAKSQFDKSAIAINCLYDDHGNGTMPVMG